ncbi:MAG TPA: cytochrome d ubiquinol oxidase subunit II [Acidobacteriaceae bacterium]|nr:cytochrome d ubiquinol oxidase subunit II [Acidobacteriaceae bacterium]
MLGLIWYWIVALMLVAYVILDGFDIGAGIAHFLIARSDHDRDIILRSIGPVWDGNEVWLLAGGGTLYFAFPLLYASSFSGFYLPLMIVLWLLILRGIGIELRSHFGTTVWRGFFDGSFAISSILLAIFLGAALANVIRGVPLDADGYFFAPLWTNWRVGPSPGILDWYTVIGGLVALVALGIHGSLYIAVKTGGELQQRARDLAQRAWILLLILSGLSLTATMLVRPALLQNYFHYPIAFLIPAGVLASLFGILLYSRKNRDFPAFLSSCLYLALMLAGAAVGLCPVLLPSSRNAAQDITISNSLSGHHGLKVGLVWWGFGILLAIGYFIFVYRMFRGKVAETAEAHGD